MIKPIRATISVDSICVKIDPIHTREGRAVNALIISKGRVMSVSGPRIMHMGCSFFKDAFKRETVREINRVGREEWKRIIARLVKIVEGGK